ncbi:unnamed protein product [Hymenolepis diminuta]|uniref:Uncharacterized protein n=1 Tax=Hymenolepis diminuta TaxID=6216 RepID=A0A0R3SXA5_HYMDI|nr:unnamed protein product [Hymenolepis diminuta]VUZ45184.1 unnamed protein product [Hymenolepis diminuta]
MYVKPNEEFKKPILEIDFVDFVEKVKNDPEFRKRVYTSENETKLSLPPKKRRNTTPIKTCRNTTLRSRRLSVTERMKPISFEAQPVQLSLPDYGQPGPSFRLPLHAANAINLSNPPVLSRTSTSVNSPVAPRENQID